MRSRSEEETSLDLSRLTKTERQRHIATLRGMGWYFWQVSEALMKTCPEEDKDLYDTAEKVEKLYEDYLHLISSREWMDKVRLEEKNRELAFMDTAMRGMAAQVERGDPKHVNAMRALFKRRAELLDLDTTDEKEDRNENRSSALKMLQDKAAKLAKEDDEE